MARQLAYMNQRCIAFNPTKLAMEPNLTSTVDDSPSERQSVRDAIANDAASHPAVRPSTSHGAPASSILQKTVPIPWQHPALPANTDTTSRSKSLRLALLGCEPNPPYGPNEHTAQLFLDLFALCCMRHEEQQKHNGCNINTTLSWTLTLEIFNVQLNEYPVDYATYDGFIIPGSFAAAYDATDWITRLQSVIQDELVAHSRPTLGVCFGHQVVAHSFRNSGRAVKSPSGARAGRQTMQWTDAGKRLFQTDSNTVDMFVTHGDVVDQLPPTAVNLGGCDHVEIQAAAYFDTIEQAEAVRSESSTNSHATCRPYAITLQAHPEYACDRELGVQRTLFDCVAAMVQRNVVDETVAQHLRQDALDSFDAVQAQSVEIMTKACRLLGWFD
ncbi:hypothetical protein MPSEU_000550600 [Mayamaea pseudoterrestris]|nr:hypothetical protein MPSEU_000550600 [Mayamaea pseudoterrestris]